MPDYGGLARSEMRRSLNTGRSAERDYLARLKGFDPQEGLETSSMGAWEAIADRLREKLGDLRGSQAAVGRLRTGFATGDEDRLYQSGLRDLNQRIAQGAMQAQGLDLARIRELGGYAGSRYAQGLEMLTSERELAAARRQNRNSGLGAALGTLGGGVIGGLASHLTGGAASFLIPDLLKGGAPVGAGIAGLFD